MRRPRNLILLTAAVLLVAGCAAAGDGTTTSAATSPPTSPATTDATAPPSVALSGDELAAAAFVPIPGYDYAPTDEGRLRAVLESIVPILPAFAGSATTALRNDQGEVAVVLSLVPIVDVRGDPALLPGLTEQLAAALDTSPAERESGGVTYQEFTTDGGPWFVWGNHTRILVGNGDDAAAAAKAFTRLALANSTEYLWSAGDCLDFVPDRAALPYAPYGDSEVVACGLRHTHEVIATVTVAEGADDPFPADLGDRVKKTCEDAFLAITGVPYWETTASLTLYLPDEAEWQAGDRYLSCVVSIEGPDGNPGDRVGGLADLPADVLRYDLTETACWGATFKPVSATDCDLPHVHEAVGTIIHPAPEGDPFPGTADLNEFRRDECEALVAATTTPAPAGYGIVAVPFSIGAAEWAEGSRSMVCAAQVQDVFGTPARIAGSLTGEWTIIAPGDSITA